MQVYALFLPVMSTLADPLVKVPLLLLTAYLNYEIWNFPTAPSAANRKKQESKDFITRIVFLNALSTKLTMVSATVQPEIMRRHLTR